MAKKLTETKKYNDLLAAVEKHGGYITSAFVFVAKFKDQLEAEGFAVEYCAKQENQHYASKACYMIYKNKK